MPDPEQVLTAAQMRAVEGELIGAGASVDDLMEQAGAGAAEWIWRVAAGQAVTILCGPGNNGGDGYVTARILRDRGHPVRIVAPLDPATGAARRARENWGGPVSPDAPAERGGVFVDCLFGSGLSRPLSPAHETLLGRLSAQHGFTVAVDLPSGVASDDGAMLGTPQTCDLTLALGAWKPAHFLMPALAILGETKLVDIGLGTLSVAGRIFARPRFHQPPRDAHKYSRGLVGVVGGAMAGAAMLAARAAMHGGAGYVKLLSAHSHPTAPGALVIDDSPLKDALGDRRWSALLVGPGLGRDEAARQRLSAVLERGVTAVLDADALHLLDDDLLEGVDAARLLVTPHAGELARLCEAFGISAERKVERAKALAQATGLTVLAKGPDTVLAAADGRIAFFPPAPTWLATAGTGDVLAGLAASRMATGREPFDAAGEAVRLHSEAAKLAGPVLIADDIVGAIPAAYGRFL